jgi:Family of unknown function (DUF6491)
MIRHFVRLGLATGLVLGAALAGAAEPRSDFQTKPATQEARIPFADLGGIRNWVADGETGLYIEGNHNQWYHATLMSHCLDLPYAERIGFVVEPDQSFDKFSAIVVRDRVCHVTSMVKSQQPDKGASHARNEKSAAK